LKASQPIEPRIIRPTFHISANQRGGARRKNRVPAFLLFSGTDGTRTEIRQTRIEIQNSNDQKHLAPGNQLGGWMASSSII
jgi:hypothetical protein